MVLLAAFILVLHTGSFAALMGLVRSQVAYETDMGAAGEVMDALHRVLTYATVLEAAERGYGFTQADIPALAEEMRTSINRWAKLVSGICDSWECFSCTRLLPAVVCCWVMQHTHTHSQHPAVLFEAAARRSCLFQAGCLVSCNYAGWHGVGPAAVPERRMTAQHPALHAACDLHVQH